MNAEGRLGWQAVRARIHARVLTGEYGPGDRLPRDEDLAAELGCARATVQRAMRDLADAGLVERRRKGGTHVRADPVTRAVLEIPVIRSEVEARGAVHGYRLTRREVAEAPPAVLARMEAAEGGRMLRVEALHLADGRPYICEDRWISLDTVPEIEAVDLGRESANEWLVRNRPYSRCDLGFHAVEAGEGEAALLETREGAALMAIERTTWIGEAPITTVRALARPGYQLRARI